jgi:hypothetical protein
MSKFLKLVESHDPNKEHEKDFILDLFNTDKALSASTSNGNIVVTLKNGDKLKFKFLDIIPCKEEEEDSMTTAANAITNFKDTPTPTTVSGKKLAGAKQKIADAADAFATNFANQVRKAVTQTATMR